jgi:hypothetical protein
LIIILSGRSRPQQFTLGPAPFSRDGSPHQSGSSRLGGPPTLTPTPAPGQSTFPPESPGWPSYAQAGRSPSSTWPPGPDSFNRASAYSQPIPSTTGELGRMPDLGTMPNLGAMPNQAAGPGFGTAPDPGAGFGAAPANGTGPDYGTGPGFGTGPDYGTGPAPVPHRPERVLSTPLDDDWPSLLPVEPGGGPQSEAPDQSDGSFPAMDNPWNLPPEG